MTPAPSERAATEGSSRQSFRPAARLQRRRPGGKPRKEGDLALPSVQLKQESFMRPALPPVAALPDEAPAGTAR